MAWGERAARHRVARLALCSLLGLILALPVADTALAAPQPSGSRYVNVDKGIVECKGQTGTRSVGFHLYLTYSSTTAISVDYFTSDGVKTTRTSQVATAPKDYTSTSGTVTFNPRETSKTVYTTVFCPPYAPFIYFQFNLNNVVGDALQATPFTYGEIYVDTVPPPPPPCPNCVG